MDTHGEAAHHDFEIPYTVHPRPDTGLYNGKLGIWLFLASEVMLFGALFSSFILIRSGAPVWPRGWEFLNVKLATANTFILIASSVTVVLAWANLRLGNLKWGRIFICMTRTTSSDTSTTLSRRERSSRCSPASTIGSRRSPAAS